MKQALLLILFIGFRLTSFSQETILDDLEIAFQKGDEKTVIAYVSDKLLLNIDQKEAVYSKSQAGMILKDFFAKNAPDSFKFIFKGPTKEGTVYASGILVSDQKKFHIVFILKEEDKDIENPLLKLDSLEIESE